MIIKLDQKLIKSLNRFQKRKKILKSVSKKKIPQESLKSRGDGILIFQGPEFPENPGNPISSKKSDPGPIVFKCV